MKLVARVYNMAGSDSVEVDTEQDKVLFNSVPKNINADRLFVKLFKAVYKWPKNKEGNSVIDGETFSLEVTVGKRYKKLIGQAQDMGNYNEFKSIIKEVKGC